MTPMSDANERAARRRQGAAMKRTPRAVFLSGERGAGKTTICLSLASENRLFSGIIEIPVMSAGEIVGITARSLGDGEEWELARTDRDLGGPRTQRFSFSRAALERTVRVIGESLARAGEITVIDEVGPLELEDGKGLAPVLPRLAAAGDLLLVVRPALVSALKDLVPRHKLAVFTVTPARRREVLERLRAFFA